MQIACTTATTKCGVLSVKLAGDVLNFSIAPFLVLIHHVFVAVHYRTAVRLAEFEDI